MIVGRLHNLSEPLFLSMNRENAFCMQDFLEDQDGGHTSVESCPARSQLCLYLCSWNFVNTEILREEEERGHLQTEGFMS